MKRWRQFLRKGNCQTCIYVLCLKSKTCDHRHSVGEGATSFPGLLHFPLDTYLIMLSVKQGGIKYHFLRAKYDSTRNWTPVSKAVGESMSSIFLSFIFLEEFCQDFPLFCFHFFFKNPSGSSSANCPSFMAINDILIGLLVTSGEILSRFLKCSFYLRSLSSWLTALRFAHEVPFFHTFNLLSAILIVIVYFISNFWFNWFVF